MALIIVSDAPVDSSSMFLKPSIISVISEREATKLRSLNTVLQKEGIYLNVRVEHEYETNCSSDIQERYTTFVFSLAVAYFAISIIWMIHVFKWYRRESSAL